MHAKRRRPVQKCRNRFASTSVISKFSALYPKAAWFFFSEKKIDLFKIIHAVVGIFQDLVFGRLDVGTVFLVFGRR